jgi:hypothetical protein
MSLMPSLCAALERVGGERLVMRAGERPHVLAGDRRHDVASAILSVNAVEALAEQILSDDGRRELLEKGAVTETIHATSFPHPLMAKAERVGDEVSVELIVQLPNWWPNRSLLSNTLRRRLRHLSRSRSPNLRRRLPSRLSLAMRNRSPPKIRVQWPTSNQRRQ